MLNILNAVRIELPALVRDLNGWSSLRVDYEHPVVDRLWRQYDEAHRILLHKIYPCDPGQSLLHPHPWPSAVQIVGGRYPLSFASYETGIGFGDPAGDPPPLAAKFIVSRNSFYEMTNPWSWHYVRPIDEPIFALMVVGEPFGLSKQDRFGQTRAHAPLDDQAKLDIFGFWQAISPR